MESDERSSIFPGLLLSVFVPAGADTDVIAPNRSRKLSIKISVARRKGNLDRSNANSNQSKY